ncbi:MAG: class D beta-lactamase [Bacteroidia bacterium]
MNKNLAPKLLLLIWIAGAMISCQKPATPAPDFESHFRENQVHGGFLLYDMKGDQYFEWNSPRLDSAYLPASTFKVFNSLVALEEKAVEDENEIFPWDSLPKRVESWNRPHSLRSAIEVSAVWFYQEVARRAGQDRMQHWIDTVGYGNRDISGGIDMFWLNGGLRITAREQVAFLQRIYHNDLPFSQRSIDILKDIMIREKGEDYVLRHKTGWADLPDPDTGWLVGWLEKQGNVWFFAMNIDIRKDEDAKARLAITKAVLSDVSGVTFD